MGQWSKIALSGSTSGQGLPVSGVSPSTGLVIHTAVTGVAQSVDEVVLYAYNPVTTPVEAYVAIGPTTATGSRYTHTLPGIGLGGVQPICPGLVVNGAITVVVYATANAAWNVFGWVNRYAS